MKDSYDLPLTTTVAAAGDAYHRALKAFAGFDADLPEHAQAALQADPDFVAAHCLWGYFMMLAYSRATVPAAAQALRAARRHAGKATAREQAHVRALERWIGGDVEGALREWELILAVWPRDSLSHDSGLAKAPRSATELSTRASRSRFSSALPRDSRRRRNLSTRKERRRRETGLQRKSSAPRSIAATASSRRSCGTSAQTARSRSRALSASRVIAPPPARSTATTRTSGRSSARSRAPSAAVPTTRAGYPLAENARLSESRDSGSGSTTRTFSMARVADFTTGRTRAGRGDQRPSRIPSSGQRRSIRRRTSSVITISSGQRRVKPSSFHLRVASIPILLP